MLCQEVNNTRTDIDKLFARTVSGAWVMWKGEDNENQS